MCLALLQTSSHLPWATYQVYITSVPDSRHSQPGISLCLFKIYVSRILSGPAQARDPLGVSPAPLLLKGSKSLVSPKVILLQPILYFSFFYLLYHKHSPMTLTTLQHFCHYIIFQQMTVA